MNLWSISSSLSLNCDGNGGTRERGQPLRVRRATYLRLHLLNGLAHERPSQLFTLLVAPPELFDVTYGKWVDALVIVVIGRRARVTCAAVPSFRRRERPCMFTMVSLKLFCLSSSSDIFCLRPAIVLMAEVRAAALGSRRDCGGRRRYESGSSVACWAANHLSLIHI